MNSSNLLARNARKYPQHEAVICRGRRVTYRDLDEQVTRFSHALVGQGVKQGDKVIIFMPNVAEFVVSYFAIQRIGAIVVPVNAKFTLQEVQYVAQHAEATAIIVHEAIFAAVEQITVPLKIKTGQEQVGWLQYDIMLQNASTQTIDCQLHEDDASTILYTSGTTGKPKGVLFSYRNILTVAQMIAVEMEVKPESRILLMMPLTHSAPLHLFLMAGVFVGSTSVLTPTFTPDLLIDSIEQERTTHFFGAPVAYLLTAQMPRLQTADLSSMKWWVYGGAPLSQNEIRFIQQAFRTEQLTCVYGLTEAGPSGSLLFGEEHATKAGSIGQRAPLGTELRIINDQGEDVGIDEVGEIVLFGEGNMLGYYKDEIATNAAFINGWLKTGDLARMDEDGFIWIVDRKKDVIISGGVNIYPKEIEDCLLSYEGIFEVAVIGVPHPQWGETVKAVYATKQDIEENALKAYLEGYLAKYKVPRIFEKVEALPRNASGKILKQSLKEQEVR
ncbi:long-chain-fatty-acid--CoA ligase [Lysinibacillus macroides]|uniref:O-succinylbenzoate--CoA ligase n=1 Tax=Lysinibacillus macroides TaxID=33935 RepID=A0A0N0CX81_9BACI|nr:long-chain-fatty-acid--CoA ligase [Lysinibacillus macroides]KOY83964.1 O-succinylbenzoate--CoA ligase [Lysinibacillus macroides]QPR66734.1 long-chain-fatty-acid--CoA ligase [Lysinibacillus macroides]